MTRISNTEKARIKQRRKIANRVAKGLTTEGRTRRNMLPFIGVDGEGWGTDHLGRQKLMMLRYGEHELYTGNRLDTEECLAFLCSLPKDEIAVGYAFNYDATMILMDLLQVKARADVLFSPWSDQSFGRHMRWVAWKGYGVQFMPRKFFSVCKLDSLMQPVKGTKRTIYDVIGFFQSTFVKALRNFNIGDEATLSMIEDTKLVRGDLDKKQLKEISEYNRQECLLLAHLMTKFRQNCVEADIVPTKWAGAGYLAQAMHKAHGTIKRVDIKNYLDPEIMEYAQRAYYGGRFEVTTFGAIEGTVYEYDICSAYPDAMRQLPCMVHGIWQKFGTEGPPENSTDWISRLHFKHQMAANCYGLPIRRSKGAIVWPQEGKGIYWGCEIKSAEALGARITHYDGWAYIRNCDCNTFQWVEEKYNYRKAIGKSGAGYPIKLGINSLYGKLAQRIGNPVFGNFLHAGGITARTRAKINTAIAKGPDDILMIATDGVYSSKPLEGLQLGDCLGEWEEQKYEDGIFIVKPGLWWTGDKTRTRGISQSAVKANKEVFVDYWREFIDEPNSAAKRIDRNGPIVPVSTRLFTGAKLAHARGRPETAGVWSDQERKITFDWSDKRRPDRTISNGYAVRTLPYARAADDLWTQFFSQTSELSELSDEDKEQYMSMPDYVSSEELIKGDDP